MLYMCTKCCTTYDIADFTYIVLEHFDDTVQHYEPVRILCMSCMGKHCRARFTIAVTIYSAYSLTLWCHILYTIHYTLLHDVTHAAVSGMRRSDSSLHLLRHCICTAGGSGDDSDDDDSDNARGRSPKKGRAPLKVAKPKRRKSLLHPLLYAVVHVRCV
jgi:hypothetical protein